MLVDIMDLYWLKSCSKALELGIVCNAVVKRMCQ